MVQAVKPDQDNRTTIESAAYKLFREIGYKLTSYTAIAEASGVGRPLVQYYFPKKDDLATRFILKVLESITGLVDATGKASPSPQGCIVQLGQVYYAFLLSDEKMRRLAYDLFSSRQVTGKVIETNAAYTIPLLGSAAEDAERLVEASVKATGGVYELMFRGLEKGLPLDPAGLAVQNVAAFLALSSRQGYEEAVGKLSSELLDGETVEGILPKLSQEIFE